jgi:2-iminobutanoate/2-iminopropanoate deaminase
MDCLLRVTMWLKDQSRQEEFDHIYRRYFSNQDALPTRTRIQVGRLLMNSDVEVEAIGYVSE